MKIQSNKILLKGDPIQKEGYADGIVRPGMLLEYTATTRNKLFELKPHATAGGTPTRNFAIENLAAAKALDEPYADNDQITYVSCYKGCEIQALVSPSAPAIVINDKLTAHSDGTLRKQTNAGHAIVAVALEAVNNSTDAQNYKFIRIEVY